ncbi:DUF6319 family protein [Pseudonocardia parietis]|uniref:Uncharacterized protein n=1 Tax=Pseudonocardia parietis TaxID=570936 RepID=A0ABS4VYA4_9PSEU|nr:DUF6319 family protein [Pseudonocardia parietis]MBP2368930.1 hypothetical protein [Pseudonocardia parietis]
MDDDLVTGDETSSTGPGTAPAATVDSGTAAPGQPTEPGTTGEPGPGTGEEAAPKRKRGRPKGSTARTTRVVTMTLTVSGSADGDWQAELKNGSTWVARGLPVTASAVSAAAAALHADLAGPVAELIESARAAKASRVAELEAELEQARKDLAELEH